MVIETDQPIPPVVRTLIGELPGVERLTYYEKEVE
jgi:L-serine dehydratase